MPAHALPLRARLCLPAALALALLAPAPAIAEERGDAAARAGETVISWEELDRLLLNRYALSQTGRSALLHLLKGRVLEHLAKEEGLEVPEREVEERAAQIEREVRASGQARDLADYLRKERVEAAIFRRFLRLAIVQETLARRALGIPEDGPISGEQQEMWLEGAMGELGPKDYEPPWKEGFIGGCGPVRISVAEFLEHLRHQLEPEDVREACFQLALEKRLRARSPDLSEEALAKAAEEEVLRRQEDVMRDPTYKGLTYAQLLESQGIRYEAWPRDPAVRIGVLARLWVERSYRPEDLKRVYADEREHFDGLFGEAIETWAIFLKAGRFENELLPRTYEEAERELEALRARVRGPADFQKLAAERSEDPGTREQSGLIGWVTRAGEERHLALKNRIFAALDSGVFEPNGPANARERMLGPLRTSTGCVLFWLGERRPPPAWESMVSHVTVELRRRFVDDTLAREELTTFLDEVVDDEQ